jgi:DNA-binding NarL/FixJ family response regulator
MSQINHQSVVIADDHDLIRHALTAVLTQASRQHGIDYQLVGTAANGLQAISIVKQEKPDILYLDLSMPLASGAEVLNDIRRYSPSTKVIVLTGISTPGLLATAMEMGCEGLMSKSTSPQDLADKLRLIVEGGRYVAPELADAIKQLQAAEQLTQRERQILNIIVAGKSNKEIARQLNISIKTVERHRTSLMAKLDVHSIAQLMARAIKDGLIDGI